jgi:hypothetical protein
MAEPKEAVAVPIPVIAAHKGIHFITSILNLDYRRTSFKFISVLRR